MKKFLACVGISLLCSNTAYASSPAPLSMAGKASIHSSPKQRLLRSYPHKKGGVRNPRTMRSHSISTTSHNSLDGNITNLASSTDAMISYRQQRHLWETSDGGLHVLINQGGSSSSTGLALYSSLDQGTTWTLSLTLQNTGMPTNPVVLPTADGLLKNNKLLLSFVTTTGAIKYLATTYDSATQRWTTGIVSTVASNPQIFIASSPTLLADSTGVFWCTFVSLNLSSKLYTIQLYRSSNQGQSWSDTGVTFSDSSHSKARSARLIALPNRLGIVYTTDKNFYWASRLNSDAANAAWKQQLTFQSTGDNTDPYGSHFSVVTDSNYNVHLSTVSNKKLVYLRYKVSNQTWDAPVVLNPFTGVAYTQIISSSDNRLFIAFNVGTNGINVLQSLDTGTTFTNAYFLPPPDTTVMGGIANFDYPRMIAPSTVTSSTLPILRQFVLDSIQRLSYYGINISP